MGIIKSIKKIIGLPHLSEESAPKDFDAFHQKIVRKVKPFTMTSPERIFSLIEATKYITKHSIEGAIVECGVWKGGSMLAVADTLSSLGVKDRFLYLYDTFEGMPEPTDNDLDFTGEKAGHILSRNPDKEKNLVWAYSSLDTVKQTLALTNYDQGMINYVGGKVEDTIPKTMPPKIALLRLDTDWYESTKHELIHLFPRLQKGGILIIDDYGFWKGARKAVDEYFAENDIQIFLSRIDDTGRIAIKI